MVWDDHCLYPCNFWFCHSVTWSLGHSVTQSLVLLFTRSLGHSVTRSLGHSDILTNYSWIFLYFFIIVAV